ncbi:PaaI family thioesterase [Maricaulis sp. D1M11]|uniref:PaaI family thioesterase n=1 Tax=Maricaulis sp. D1M11 TaxID=3076117 RepID=UPI0039B4D3E8
MSDDLQALLDELAPLLVDGSPHAQALGLSLVSISPGEVVLKAPYREDLIGDPETGTLHGGVITALLDHAAGTAAFAGLGAKEAPATLDLRIDYSRPAEPGKDVIATAQCLKSHGLIAFVRAIAHDGDPDDPVAIAQAAFMISKPSVEARKRVQSDANRGTSS